MALPPGKVLALAVRLACAPARRARGEQLIELLWPDRDSATGHHDLRQAVWQLRRRLGRGTVSTERGEVLLRAPVRLDRDAFLSAVDEGALERAVALYGGDFVAGFSPLGATGFEQWAEFERYRLRRTFVRAAESVIRQRLAAGQFADAQSLARRVRDADPHEETAWALLLETLLSAGDAINAAAEADLFERVLADDGRDPEPATRSLLRRARRAAAGQAGSIAPTTPVTALLGREQEFAALMRAWERARRGAGGHIAVTGASGMGKTRLLQELQIRLNAAGVSVHSLRARFAGRRVVYGFASEVAATLVELPGSTGVSPATAGVLVSLNPSLSSRFASAPDAARDEEALRRRALAVFELVAAVADEQPLVLLCDDFQWVDQASSALLQWLFGQLHAVPALCITATIPSAEVVAETPKSEHLELRPLSVDDTRALVTSVAQLPNDQWARDLPERLHAVTGGSPGQIQERLETGLERGQLRISSARWSCGDPAAFIREVLGPTGTSVDLVVLPFVTQGSAGHDHLAIGLTEGLIEDLSRIPGLRVIAHASALRLQGFARDLKAISAAVRVRYVLEGSVQIEDDRLEVLARVQDAATGAVLREEVCIGSRTDPFALRERVARVALGALHLWLDPQQEQQLRRRPVADTHAYECFLRARACILRFTPAELARALDILRYGLELAGENALLYAALGMVYWNLLQSGSSTDGTLVQRAEEYAAKAFALDPDLAQGHVLAGLIARLQGRRGDAVARFRRALALDPNNLDALYWLGCAYAVAGRCSVARALANRLLELDPLTGLSHFLPALIEMADGRFAHAVPAVRRASQLDPNPTGRVLYAITLVRAQHVDAAHVEFARLAREEPGAFATQLGALLRHALLGKRHEALAAAAAVEPVARSVEYLAWEVGAAHALMGESERAIDWLTRAVTLGFTNYPFLMADPLLERIRGAVAFVQLAERVRQEWQAFVV